MEEDLLVPGQAAPGANSGTVRVLPIALDDQMLVTYILLYMTNKNGSRS
jgi:hypothetical protein